MHTNKVFKLPKYNREKADPNGYYANRNKKVNYKVVYRFSYDGKFIGEYKFNHSLCKEDGLNYDGIRLASRPTWSDKKRILSSMDSIWILKDDYSEDELKRKINDKQMDGNINPKANKKSKKIIQRCADTREIIQVWDSINQAGKEEVTGYKLANICKVLNGSRHTYLGYTWEYLN